MSSLPVDKSPASYSYRRLLQSFPADESTSEDWQSLADIQLFIRSDGLPTREDEDGKYVSQLLTRVSNAVLPGPQYAIRDDYEKENQKIETVVSETQKAAFASGLWILRELSTSITSEEADFRVIILAALVFTDQRDTWTTNSAFSEACKILELYEKALSQEAFMVESLLRGFVQPLFSRSKPSSITSQGRKAHFPEPDRGRAQDSLDPLTKPWKFQTVYTITVFSWVVRNANESLIADKWPLFTPPLLTLVDDGTTEVRARGLETLSRFLGRMPPRALRQTGLGEVFEDAITPTLSFLPSLTPVGESARLLAAAYDALFVLADARFPREEEEEEEEEEERAAKMRSYDRIMRRGIVDGYAHCPEHVDIVRLLLETLGVLVRKMGMFAVKHLKDIVPMVTKILSDPFGSFHATQLLAAITTLQATILNCWPRLSGSSPHQNEIVKALVLCWTSLRDAESSQVPDYQIEKIRSSLTETAELLSHATRSKADFSKEVGPIVKFDPDLARLLGRGIGD